MATLKEEQITKIISSFMDLLKKQIEGDIELNKTLRELQLYMEKIVKSDEFREKISLITTDISKLEKSIDVLSEDFYEFSKTISDSNVQYKIEQLKAETELKKTEILSNTEENKTNKSFLQENIKLIIGVLSGVILTFVTVFANKMMTDTDKNKQNTPATQLKNP